MKNLKRIALYSSLALLLAAIPAAVLAAGHGPGHRPGHGGVGFGEHPWADRMADRLDLSEGQREQIRTIHEGYREDAERLMEAARTAREDLGDRIHADSFDETTIREAAGKVGAAEADLAVLRARIASDVRQVLTPEQAAEARELHDRMKEFGGDRRGHHHDPWGGRGPEGPPVDGE